MTSWLPSIDGRDGPIYLAIIASLAEDVAAGRLPEGSRLPTHRDLAALLGGGRGPPPPRQLTGWAGVLEVNPADKQADLTVNNAHRVAMEILASCGRVLITLASSFPIWNPPPRNFLRCLKA